jgi:choline-glycine betaine transporter
MKKLHTWAGWLLGLVFAGTGAWMRVGFPALHHDNGTVHMAYRANHIYILGAALIHAVLGAYYVAAPGGLRHGAQTAGSVLLVAAAVLLVVAFIVDPPSGEFARQLSALGIVALLSGGLLHIICQRGAASSR